MRRPFLTVSVLAVVAAAACGDSLTEPAESIAQPPAISADVGPPDMSGAVERFFGLGSPPPIYDADTNLSAMGGIDVASFCLAGGPGVANPADYFEGGGNLSFVHAPGQGGLITIRGEGPLYVWYGVVAFDEVCTAQLLGEGWAKTTYTENATSPQDAGPNIADTFLFSGRGPVTTADGIKQALMKVSGRVKNGVLEALDFTVEVSN
ncbi:MAG: hypothetical protein P8Y15_11095 [Gemmatimonadales bacterium]